MTVVKSVFQTNSDPWLGPGAVFTFEDYHQYPYLPAFQRLMKELLPFLDYESQLRFRTAQIDGYRWAMPQQARHSTT